MSGPTRRPPWWRLLLVLIALGLITILVLRSGIGARHWTPQTLRAEILSWGWWAPVAYIAGFTLRVFVLIPASVMILVGALLFGPWWGALYTVVGGTLCAAIEFGVARWVGREMIERWLTSRLPLEAFEQRLARRGFVTVLVLRLVPNVPFELLNATLGVSPVRWRNFLTATALGFIPWTFAFGWAGEALLADTRRIWALLGILTLISASVWLPRWLWRRRAAAARRPAA